MPNVLALGLAFLTDQLITHASELITYSRGASSVAIRATYGKKLLKIDDGEGGFRIEFTDMDFLIRASDLILSAVAITPERGDTIAITVGVGTETFEVFPFNAEPAWRWSDPHRSMIRVHCKHVT